MKAKMFVKRSILILGLGIVIGSFVGCGGNGQADYSPRIEKEIAKKIAAGELRVPEQGGDVPLETDTTDAQTTSGDGTIGTPTPTLAPFVQSNGPDEMTFDEIKYYKIGTKYQPGLYVAVTNQDAIDQEYSGYYAVVMDDEEHTLVDNANLSRYRVFDTLNGQYLTFTDCKIYPINEAPSVEKTKDGGYYEGLYHVGSLMPAGEYVIKGDDVSANTYKDLTGAYESKLGYTYGEHQVIIKVEDGQFIEATWGNIYPIEQTANLKPGDGVYKSGMYKVGFHMPAGTYTIKADVDTAYALIYNDCIHDGHEDKGVEAKPEATFTVKDGQYVQIISGKAMLQK